MYRAREFARLTGVTVRALHHYDRLGLLRPRRSPSGYRLYGDRDLVRLEQIVALKFIGVPLRQIPGLLERGGGPLREALRAQRRVLEEKRALLGRAIGAIRAAESAIDSGRVPDAALFRKIIEVIEMQDTQDWMARYSNDAAKVKIKARQGFWTPELQEQVSRQWMELIGEIEAAVKAGEDPNSSKARGLARRWKELVEGFTGGDPDLIQAVKNVWADRANWPAEAQAQMGAFRISPEVWRFVKRAMGGTDCG